MNLKTLYEHLGVTREKSRGREYPVKDHPYRCAFDRDRDRIIHASSFRRLEGKTQVFSPGIDDNFRTRLTHTIEVAQIGRTIAHVMGLNESLTEAICLAHDLGHSPFGHCGESILNELMSGFGGFEHNRQSLRQIELLEHPYPEYMGLNLMYETRLGLGRHHSTYDLAMDARFPEKHCSLEGQITNCADRIAYNCHDLEDGMRSRIIRLDQVKDMDLVKMASDTLKVNFSGDSFVKSSRIVKTMLDFLVGDLIETTYKNIENFNIKTLEDVYYAQEDVVGLSAATDSRLRDIEHFLMENLYMTSSMKTAVGEARECLEYIFARLVKEPELMPKYYRGFIERDGLHRAVCDYISGMTDKFCLQYYNKLKNNSF
ncbi:Deoxyguanosinetriphosphate triphosphohydrolase [Limihaloglobus sulfuriphilus]|uniref:Deoxyguanosinetriphosphate triphosphohydrolase-like protein n=1 Tax=Limihaloglobus sulfuriphilus TaxID=1851148 RepID=A0A1Q2MBN8_9BACT|nr:dNTP triphosphohydrolase [Limihaloglobus sulfuriphilus]AQQ69948.1 Deoxyguanosinetriphosphate triphosphohydrolase [Limihaloglobus sulfuriphilus]